MGDASYHSPARSVGEPSSQTESENESESWELVTEEPGSPEQTIIDGWLKFRDLKKWKQRWGVVTKLSPAADCLHLQLYRDSKDRYKQGQTKASLSLQHFLGVQSGFTLDKESNTIAIICQDVTVVLAFDTRERLIQWQVKIANNLGEDERFLVQISSAPLRAKLSPGPAMLHVLEYQFCLTVGVPPRLVNHWQISQLRRYGVVESRFCFEGGSRCGKGEGLYVLVTDQGDDITRTFRLAAEGKLSSKRRPSSRSASDSPKKSVHGRAETRMSDVSCLDSLLQAPTDDSQLTEACECSRTDQVLAWHVSDQVPDFADASSVADFMDTHPKEGSVWMGDAVMERCSSCISKLGALSRSSTAAMTPNSSFTPAWTMESRNSASKPETDKNEETTQQAYGGFQQFEVPAAKYQSSDNWHSEESHLKHLEERCVCCPPARPPKPGHFTSQATNKPGSPKKKPTANHEQNKHSCSCNITVNPYDNYDVPLATKAPHMHTCQKEKNLHWIQNPMATEPEYYDTPKNIIESCVNEFTNYDIPLSTTMDKKPMCTSIKKNQYLARVIIDNEQMHMVPCPCQRMVCWPENWMIFPYCRRGNGRENTTSPSLHKKHQECGQQMHLNNLSSVYATVDKSKKIKNRQFTSESSTLETMQPSLKESSFHITPSFEKDKQSTTGKEATRGTQQVEEESGSKLQEQNYMNSDYLQSLELYENSKGFMQRPNENYFKGRIHTNSSNRSSQVEGDSKICTKCKYGCKGPLPNPDDRQQDDYLMMEPSGMDRCVKRSNKVAHSSCSRHVPGYLPMHPIGGNCINNQELLKSRLCQHLGERAASSPSLIDHSSDRQRKLMECETQRLSDHGLTGHNQSVSATSSPYLRRRVLGCVHELTEIDAHSTTCRRRTSSAESKCNLNNEDARIEKSQQLCDFINKNVQNKPTLCHKSGSKKSVDFDIRTESNLSKDSIIVDDNSCPEQEIQETVRVSSRSSSNYDNIDWAKLDSNEPLVHKRSSSVPSKSSNNRDSLSSNDSGVSSCSLKKRMADFMTDDQSSSSGCGRHYTYTRADSGSTSESFHYSLPRRSKSVDPLQDLAFQFQKVEVPMKSSSAEAEVPICQPTKRESKGCLSPGSAVPYTDSRSTSSGTSDMSDYFETLSLSSYSSSDTPDSLHFGHQGVSTMRPRSGKEYQKIDRNLLDESKKTLLPPLVRDNEKKGSSS